MLMCEREVRAGRLQMRYSQTWLHEEPFSVQMTLATRAVEILDRADCDIPVI